MAAPLAFSQASNKTELTHLLVKLRLRSDFEANAKGITEAVVDGFSDDEIVALPESTLVHIVDAYFIMTRNGVSDAEIFKKIEMQRSLLGEVKTVPENTNLSKYIKLRFKSDFPQMNLVDEMVINLEILYAVTWFSKDIKSKYTWKNADDYSAKVFAQMEKKYVESQADPLDDESVIGEVDEVIEEGSKGKKGLMFFGLFVIVGLLVYWLLFMGGLD